jgi:uncharacterized protein (TIGR02145 family)
VPTGNDWSTLFNNLNNIGYKDIVAKVLTSTKDWTGSSSIKENIVSIFYNEFRNKFNFNALPTGTRTETGTFTGKGDRAVFLRNYKFSDTYTQVYEFNITEPSSVILNTQKNNAAGSIRCLKN